MQLNNSQIKWEAGSTLYPMEALTDSGDHITFNSNANELSENDNPPNLQPDGVLTGCVVSPAASGGNDKVDVSAGTASIGGVVVAVSAATDVTITRPATAVSKVNSLVVDNAGTITAVAGTDGATTAFSEARGAAGSAPYIAVSKLELSQVRVTSNTAGPITANQILSNPGQYREVADLPIFTINNDDGTVKASSALPLIHTGDLAKGVFMEYAEPIMSELNYTADFVPSGKTLSVTSKAWYDGLLSITESESITAGSFKMKLNNGFDDAIVSKEGQNLFWRFYPDKNQTKYIKMQGRYSVSTTFTHGDNPEATITIAAVRKAVPVVE